MSVWKISTILALTIFATGNAYAQKVDIDALKKQIQTDSDEFSELRGLLKNPDINVRLAAFDAMVKHGDPSLYEIAISSGLVDTDEVLRARALWETLSRRRSITFLIDPDKKVEDEKTRKILDTANTWTINIRGVYEAGKCLNFRSSSQSNDTCQVGGNFSISGTTVQFIQNYSNWNSSAQLFLEGDGVLQGKITDSAKQIVYPVEIDLR